MKRYLAIVALAAAALAGCASTTGGKYYAGAYGGLSSGFANGAGQR